MNAADRIKQLAAIANDESIPLADRSLAVKALTEERNGLIATQDQTRGTDWAGLLSGDSEAVPEKLAKYLSRADEAGGELQDTAQRLDAIPPETLAQFPEMTLDNNADIGARNAGIEAQDDYKIAHLGETHPYSNAIYDELGLGPRGKSIANGLHDVASTAASMAFPTSPIGIAAQAPINLVDSLDAFHSLKEMYQNHPKTAAGLGVATYASQVPDWVTLAKAIR